MLDLLRRVVEPDCVLDPQVAPRWSVRGVPPRALVAPRTADEAAAVVRLAAEHGWSVRFAGAATRLDHGNVIGASDIIITTRKLNSLSDYEPADLVMTAQAGVSVAQIASAARRHKQFLALDPPVARASTIGAVIATGMAGPLRFKHGTPRDHALGLQVVAGDARLLNFGGKVVKNVAGYDVVRPLIGSNGTLGLITQVSVRLKPLPDSDQTVAIPTASFAAAGDIAAGIFDRRIDAAALEVVSPELAQVCGFEHWTVLCRLQGNTDSVRYMTEQLKEIAGSAVLRNDPEPWPALAVHEHEARVNIRCANLRSRITETMASALRTADATALKNPRYAIHAGDGIVRILADGVGRMDAAAIEQERAVLAAGGGTLLVKRAPHTAEWILSRNDSATATLMAGIKRVFDPANILPPTELLS